MPEEVTQHITARIPRSQYEFLKELQESIGGSFSEALRHAITIAKMVREEKAYLTLASTFVFGSRFRRICEKE